MSAGLCQLAAEWRGEIPPGGLPGERKIDGFRALWVRDIAGRNGLWTRNGHPIEGVAHIAHRLEQMERAAGESLFLDGEFQVDGTLAATKDWCERGWRCGDEAGVLHLFDCMTLAEWRAGGTDRPWYERKARLVELGHVLSAEVWEWRPGSHGRDDPHCVRIVPDEWVFDVEHLRSEAERVWATGGEGIMLKSPDAPYRRTRSAAWQKVKHRAQFKLAA